MYLLGVNSEYEFAEFRNYTKDSDSLKYSSETGINNRLAKQFSLKLQKVQPYNLVIEPEECKRLTRVFS